MSWVAAAIGGSAVIGGGLSYLSQSRGADRAADAATDSAMYQTNAVLEMFNLTRDDWAPFRQIGLDSLLGLTGKSTYADAYAAGTEKWVQAQNSWVAGGKQGPAPKKEDYLPSEDEYGGYVQTGDKFDITGGAGKYLEQYEGLDVTSPDKYMQGIEGLDTSELDKARQGISGFDLSGTQKYIQGLEGIDPTAPSKYLRNLENIDATAPSKYLQQLEGLDTSAPSKYRGQLEELKFELDKDDEVYKWRQKQGEEAINAALAARGIHDSSYAVDRIAEFTGDLTADEVDRQYEQNYLAQRNQLNDLYNMANQDIQRKYGQITDLYGMSSQDVARQMGQQSELYGMSSQDVARQAGQQMDLYNLANQAMQQKYGQQQDIYNTEVQDVNRRYGQQMDLYNLANQGLTRQSGQLMDLYNLATNLAGKQYGSAMDLVNIGTGATSASGSAAQNTGGQLSSIYGQLGQNQAQSEYLQGAAGGQFWSGLAGMPLNYYTASQYGGGIGSSLFSGGNWGSTTPSMSQPNDLYAYASSRGTGLI